MSMNQILYDIRSEEEEIITTKTIQGYSNKKYYEVGKVINYLTSQGYILKILNNMFYVKDIDEFNKKELKYSQHELIAKALELKNAKNWYFGLHTALTFELSENNDVFFKNDTSIDYIINDRISVKKPLIINGDKFSFLVFKKELLNFGVKDHGIFRYSNLEKTILDFIYLYNCNHVREGKILVEVSKYKHVISLERLMKYSKHYPAEVGKILERINIFK